MGESTNQIEQEIMAERRQLGRNLSELEMKAQQLSDWRTYYRRNPTLLLGLAVGGGLALSAMARRRRSISPVVTGPVASVRGSLAPGRTRRHVQDTWDTVSEVLLGMAAGKVMEFVGEFVPGFTDELSRRHPGSVGLPRPVNEPRR